MFCGNCGKNLSNNALFCPGCGSKVSNPIASEAVNPNPIVSEAMNPSPILCEIENPSQIAHEVENPVQYNYESSTSANNQYIIQNPNSKVKNKKKAFTTGILAIMGIAVIFSICYAFFAPSIKAAILGPKNYYFTLEKNNLLKVSQDIKNSYTKNYPKKYNYEYDLSTKLSGDIIDESEEIKNIIESLSKIHLNLKLDGNNENLQDSYFTASIEGKINDKIIGSIVAESADNKTKISLPDLTDKTIGYEAEVTSVKLASAMQGDDKAFEEVFGIEKEAFNKMMRKYVEDTVFGCIADGQFQFEKDAKYQDIGCNSIMISLDEKTISDILNSLATEIEKDNDLKTILKSSTTYYFDMAKLSMDDKPSSEDIDKAVETFCTSLKDTAMDIGKTSIEYSIYFDNSGTIIGRKFINKETDTLAEIASYKSSDKKDVLKCNVEQNGERILQFSKESRLEKGNNVGTLALKANEKTLLDAKYTSEIGATVGGLNAFVGNLQGKVNLESLSDSIYGYSESPLQSIDFSYDSKRSEKDRLLGEFKISTEIDGKSLIATLFTEIKQSNINSIKKPVVSISDSIDISDAEGLSEFESDIGISLGNKIMELFPDLY